MMINEFIGKVAGGEISSIDIRKFFVGLSDLDKSDLLQDMFIESLADGLSGHNNEEQRLADAINMLCDVFCWCYESDKKKYIHKPTREQPEQVSDVQTTDAQSLNPKPQQAEQERNKQPKQLGRKMKAVKDLILPTDKEQVLEKLRNNMQGQNQDTAMAILINALNNKVLLKPSWKAFCDAFPNVKIAEATYYSKLKKAGWGQS